MVGLSGRAARHGLRLHPSLPAPAQGGLDLIPAAWWAEPADRLAGLLGTGPDGLTTPEAEARLRATGANVLRAGERASALRSLVAQFRNPLLLILLGAAAVSMAVGDLLDAGIVLTIVVGSALLGFVQEFRASKAVEKLRAGLKPRATVVRDGREQPVPAETLVPGDVVLLSAGSLVPADGLILAAKDFFVSEAVLTGEPLPVEKQPGTAPADAGLARRGNCVFMGTSVRSGTARVLVVKTGPAAEYGTIAGHLLKAPPETAFERGIRRFGYLLTQVMLALTFVVFAANLLLDRPFIESLLFSIALAVGLSPELLPAIMTITLASGARKMAARGVIVRRLSAIENLGSMDLLCSDKTGTLTLGAMRLDRAVDTRGEASPRVLGLAWLNASLETGLPNPLDEAIRNREADVPAGFRDWRKLDEIPYDFVRKRLSIVARDDGGAPRMITKGALAAVLAVCDRARGAEGDATVTLDAVRARVLADFEAASAAGFRVLGLATRDLPVRDRYERGDESGMVFEGCLLFFDPPDPEVPATLASLARLGVELKIITGDNRLAAAHVAAAVGLGQVEVMTGDEMDALGAGALATRAARTGIFAEVDPAQKERIILALRQAGRVVGYMGDGINDAPALHAADVGISVSTAVDVAKEAADFVLLEHDLDVLRRGIEEGRRTFANSLKYIYTTTSANFGNMISMAAASLFLPFLPLLATQILLNNFLSDFPAMAIATDNVDPEMVEAPHGWDIARVRNFMIVFGLVSSAFDFLTFGALWQLTGGVPALFRTGWFVESLLTELTVALVVRTYRPFYQSRPGRWLLRATLVMMGVTVALPYLPLGDLFQFEPLPGAVLAAIVAITGLYLLAAELAKHFFYRRWAPATLRGPAERRTPGI